MITTVTTTTVTTVTTVALAGSLGVFLVITLMVCMIKKEIFASSANERARNISKVLNVAIIPLLVVFVLLAVERLMSL
jgi:hypothetical protein